MSFLFFFLILYLVFVGAVLPELAVQEKCVSTIVQKGIKILNGAVASSVVWCV